MARHLHHQAGGDPRQQGPVPEFANKPPSPGVDNDFPDVPDANRPPAVDDETRDDEARVDESGDDDAGDDGDDDTED